MVLWWWGANLKKDSVYSKIINWPLCVLFLYSNISNNEYCDFKTSTIESKRDDTMETNIMSKNNIIIMDLLNISFYYNQNKNSYHPMSFAHFKKYFHKTEYALNNRYKFPNNGSNHLK